MSKKLAKRPYEKNLRIGVRFDGQRFVLLNGDPLPRLEKNCVAELLISPDSILDSVSRDNLLAELSVSFLSADQTVMMGVSRTMMDEEPLPGLINARDLGIASKYAFVPVTIKADLYLRVRGDQEAALCTCRCYIETLNKTVDSLNEAFTRISEAYETKRRSHSGNVFDRAWAQRNTRYWRTLDDLRREVISTGPQAAKAEQNARLVGSKTVVHE